MTNTLFFFNKALRGIILIKNSRFENRLFLKRVILNYGAGVGVGASLISPDVIL